MVFVSRQRDFTRKITSSPSIIGSIIKETVCLPNYIKRKEYIISDIKISTFPNLQAFKKLQSSSFFYLLSICYTILSSLASGLIIVTVDILLLTELNEDTGDKQTSLSVEPCISSSDSASLSLLLHVFRRFTCSIRNCMDSNYSQV